jgi:Tol biopolymer transport system component
MPSLDDRFRALEKIGPPERWPELDELETQGSVPPTPFRMRLGVIALALLVAVAGFVFAIRSFRSEQPPPQPGSPAENGLIAFGRGGTDAGLYATSPDGSDVSRLTSNDVDQDPAWSPDGSKIAFVRGFWDQSAGIYVMNADGTGVRRITDGGSGVDGADLNPDWSPIGDRIAFAREGRPEGADVGNTDIYVVNADGTGLARLTDSPEMEYAPAWSPDGSRIAFIGYDLASVGRPPSALRLYVMNADGTGVERLGPQNVEGPAWSPDGSEIAFVDTEEGSIMATRPDGTGLRRILDVTELVGGVHLVYGVTWSPDGTKIAFSAGPDSDDMHIYVVDRDGSGVIQLTDGPASDALPVWQPVRGTGTS